MGKLGRSEGHIQGKGKSGKHTTVIGHADKVLKELADHEWFDTARTGEIRPGSGGQSSITVKRHPEERFQDTLDVAFKQGGTVQHIYLHVANLEARLSEVVGDITDAARKKLGNAVTVYDKTSERSAFAQTAQQRDSSSPTR